MISPYPESDAAREWLRVVFRGMGFDPGLLFCGICPAGGWRPGPFPASAWPMSAELDTSVLAGPGWEMPEWTLLLPEWPRQADFERAVTVTLEAMVSGGAVVAWVGYETDVVTPDGLFLPKWMSGGVFTALTFDGRRYGRILLDGPLAGISDEELLELRAATNGLAELPPA